MEDQDLPKKLTPEEIEQQKKNLERQQEEIKENPVEKDSGVRLSDINEDITQKGENIRNTQNKINDIRDQLGLPPSAEVPSSIKNDQDSIGKLNQEKLQIEEKMKEVESRANNMTTNEGEKFSVLTDSKDIQEYKELKKQLVDIESKNPNETNEKSEETKKFEGNLKTILDDISTKSKTMLDALYERQQQQFTSLQSPDEFQGIVSHLKSIKNFDGKFDINGLDLINENIQKISRLIENMNPKQTGGEVRDNPQNLEKLAYGAKSFSASLDEAGRNLGPELADEKMEDKRKELRKSLGILSEQTQKLNSLASRMRNNFR